MSSTQFQEGQTITPITASWLNGVNQFVYAGGSGFVTFAGSGPTASRPATPVLYSMYIDTDLKEPIWCTQVTPNVIWINAAGAQV